ncbi:MAG TPA: hypothetical protein VE669_01255 [Actinomycetota bacterium]|nr:hypothetical protein [Actinomycetota bacterium]
MDRYGHRTWHFLVTIVFTGVCAWFVFRVETRPPGIAYMDLATHELGHRLFSPFGQAAMLVMGNGTQILVPLVLATVMLTWRRDLLAGAVFLAWTGEAFGDTAIYVADAPCGCLPLLGGDEGDWTRLLGPEHWSRMHLADEYAGDLRAMSAIAFLVAVALSLYAVWSLRGRWRPARRPAAAPNVDPKTSWP